MSYRSRFLFVKCRLLFHTSLSGCLRIITQESCQYRWHWDPLLINIVLKNSILLMRLWSTYSVFRTLTVAGCPVEPCSMIKNEQYCTYFRLHANRKCFDSVHYEKNNVAHCHQQREIRNRLDGGKGTNTHPCFVTGISEQTKENPRGLSSTFRAIYRTVHSHSNVWRARAGGEGIATSMSP